MTARLKPCPDTKYLSSSLGFSSTHRSTPSRQMVAAPSLITIQHRASDIQHLTSRLNLGKNKKKRSKTMRTSYVRCCIFAVMMMLMVGMPASSGAQVSVGIAVGFAPPDLPVYEQPICPEEGYIWTPGYWAYDPDFGDYYWVPGTWVMAPPVGILW